MRGVRGSILRGRNTRKPSKNSCARLLVLLPLLSLRLPVVKFNFTSQLRLLRPIRPAFLRLEVFRCRSWRHFKCCR